MGKQLITTDLVVHDDKKPSSDVVHSLSVAELWVGSRVRQQDVTKHSGVTVARTTKDEYDH